VIKHWRLQGSLNWVGNLHQLSSLRISFYEDFFLDFYHQGLQLPFFISPTLFNDAGILSSRKLGARLLLGVADHLFQHQTGSNTDQDIHTHFWCLLWLLVCCSAASPWWCQWSNCFFWAMQGQSFPGDHFHCCKTTWCSDCRYHLGTLTCMHGEILHAIVYELVKQLFCRGLKERISWMRKKDSTNWMRLSKF